MLNFKLISTPCFHIAPQSIPPVNGFLRGLKADAAMLTGEGISFCGYESSSGQIIPASRWAIFQTDSQNVEGLIKRLDCEFFVARGYTYAGTPYLRVYKSVDLIELWIPIK